MPRTLPQGMVFCRQRRGDLPWPGKALGLVTAIPGMRKTAHAYCRYVVPTCVIEALPLWFMLSEGFGNSSDLGTDAMISVSCHQE